MPETDPAPAKPNKDVAYAAAQATLSQAQKAAERAMELSTPWLVDVGNWIFAGLIAFILVVIAPIIAATSIDQDLTIATVAFVLALPLDLAGLVMLRLIRDVAHLGFSEEWARAYQEAGLLPLGEQLASPQVREAQRKRQATVVMYYSFAVLALSVALTLTGLTAALWHLAWWIGVVFLAMTAISLGIVIALMVTLGPRDTPEDRARQRRYWEDLTRQLQAQAQAEAQAQAQAQSKADQ